MKNFKAITLAVAIILALSVIYSFYLKNNPVNNPNDLEKSLTETAVSNRSSVQNKAKKKQQIAENGLYGGARKRDV